MWEYLESNNHWLLYLAGICFLLYFMIDEKGFRFPTDRVNLSGLVLSISILLITSYYHSIRPLVNTKDQFPGILTELFGAIFDVVILVFLFNIMEQQGERRREIDRLTTELRYYEGWSSEEAAYRVSGIVSRLQTLGAKREEIDLSNLQINRIRDPRLIERALDNEKLPILDLTNAKLHDIKLRNVDTRGIKNINFNRADLTGATLENSYLSLGTFEFSILNRTRIENWKGIVNFYKSEIRNTSFKDSTLLDSGFNSAHFQDVNFNNVILSGAGFIGAFLDNVTFNKSDLSSVEFYDAKLIQTSFEESDIRRCTLHKVKSLVGVHFNNTKVSDKFWIQNFRAKCQAGINIDEIEENFYVDDRPRRDKGGRIYYLLMKKPT